MVNIRKIQKRDDGKVDEGGGKQAEDIRKSMLRQTVKCFKTLGRTEAKKESEETQEEVELTEVKVYEEEIDWRAKEETQFSGRWRRLGSRASPRRSGGRDELHGKDAWDVRVCFRGKKRRRKTARL